MLNLQTMKVFSVVTAMSLGAGSLVVASTPAKAGGEAVAAGIIGFTAGAIVGSHARPRYYGHRYYGPRYYGYRTSYRPAYRAYRAPRRSAEERQYWMSIQDALNRSGFAAGPVDGAPGRLTRSAIRSYQLSIPAEPTGKLTAEQTQQLFARAQEMETFRTSNPPGPQAQPQPLPVQTQTPQAVDQPQSSEGPDVISVSTHSPAPDRATGAGPETAKVEIDADGQPFIMVDGRKLLLQTGVGEN